MFQPHGDAPAFEPMRQRRTVFVRLTAGMLILAWLILLGWSIYEVELTRSSRADNFWVLPDLAVLIALLVVTVSVTGQLTADVPGRVKASVLAIAALIAGGVLWAWIAPLPQLATVPRPSETATPLQVVEAFVLALDKHDTSTAEALCARRACPPDEYVRVRIIQIGPATHTQVCVPVASNGSCRFRNDGVDVGVELSGLTRNGHLPGEDGAWGYVLAPIGPHGGWRIADQGTG